ncbi:hypothetical protein HN803_00175 [candidate division WWE3 bacterium]|nr:hypothetical protein [candidate division WWE3 bacterium]
MTYRKATTLFLGLFVALFLATSLSPTVYAKKWTYKAWAARRDEKDQRVAEMARKRPNAYRNYVNNVAKDIIGKENVGGSNDPTKFNAWNYNYSDLLRKGSGFLSQGATQDTSATNMIRGQDGFVWLKDSNGNFTQVESNNYDLSLYQSKNGTATLCVGWGCLAGNYTPAGGGGGGAVCTATAPSGSLALVSPTNNSDVEAESGKVTLSWDNFSSWGACCGACTRTFQVFLGKEGESLIRVGSISESINSLEADVEVDATYNWYVIALNSDTGLVRSPTWSFKVLPGAQPVTGYIWDSTGLSCTADKDSNEIQRSDVDGNVAVSVGATVGTWDPSFSGHSYEVTNVPYGPGQVICANIPDPIGKPNFRYALTCADDSASGLVSGSCATIDVLGPTNRDLGYKLTSVGWFQSIGGDVFGGCDEANCAASVSVGIPSATEILGGFAKAIVAEVGTLFGDSGFSITDNAFSEDNNRHLEFMNSKKPWPKAFTLTPSDNVDEVTDCDSMFAGDLDGGSMYKADVSCVQSGLENLSGGYSLASDGVAVVYVEDFGTLMFEKDFVSSSVAQRVMFISEGSVEFGSEFGVVSPTKDTAAQVQASIITEGSIIFKGKTGADVGTDTTLVVEGPIVSKEGSVSFDRDRGLDNGYPAEVVVYNPIYLTDAPEGLNVLDISWAIDN